VHGLRVLMLSLDQKSIRADATRGAQCVPTASDAGPKANTCGFAPRRPRRPASASARTVRPPAAAASSSSSSSSARAPAVAAGRDRCFDRSANQPSCPPSHLRRVSLSGDPAVKQLSPSLSQGCVNSRTKATRLLVSALVLTSATRRQFSNHLRAVSRKLAQASAAHRGADAAKLAAGSTNAEDVMAQGGSGKWRTVTADGCCPCPAASVLRGIASDLALARSCADASMLLDSCCPKHTHDRSTCKTACGLGPVPVAACWRIGRMRAHPARCPDRTRAQVPTPSRVPSTAAHSAVPAGGKASDLLVFSR